MLERAKVKGAQESKVMSNLEGFAPVQIKPSNVSDPRTRSLPPEAKKRVESVRLRVECGWCFFFGLETPPYGNTVKYTTKYSERLC